jgi:hypothetical protein
MKNVVSWNVTPYSLVDSLLTNVSGVPYCLQHIPDDGGSNHLWNVGQYLPDYTA